MKSVYCLSGVLYSTSANGVVIHTNGVVIHICLCVHISDARTKISNTYFLYFLLLKNHFIFVNFFHKYIFKFLIYFLNIFQNIFDHYLFSYLKSGCRNIKFTSALSLQLHHMAAHLYYSWGTLISELFLVMFILIIQLWRN